MCHLDAIHPRIDALPTSITPTATCFHETCCARHAGLSDDETEDDCTSWEDLLPELETDDDEPFDPLPDFGDPPPWADLDDWDNDE